jgi:hypothetical protein
MKPAAPEVFHSLQLVTQAWQAFVAGKGEFK